MYICYHTYSGCRLPLLEREPARGRASERQASERRGQRATGASKHRNGHSSAPKGSPDLTCTAFDIQI